MDKSIKSTVLKFEYERKSDGKDVKAYNTISNVAEDISDEVVSELLSAVYKLQKNGKSIVDKAVISTYSNAVVGE